MDFLKLRNKIKGPDFPIVTPFKEDYNLDTDGLLKYLDFLYAGGARIFHVMIHTSRFGLLLPEEMKKVNAIVARHVKKNFKNCIVIAANPIYGPTYLSQEFSQQARDNGADVIGAYFCERYYNAHQVYDFFEAMAKSCDIGILIHEQQLATIHGSTLMLFPEQLLDQLADIENIIAIKEDAKEDEYTYKIVNLLKDRVNIIVSGGSKEQFMKFGPLGSQAYLVGVASFWPELAVKFYDDYLRGDTGACWKIINEIEQPFFQVSKRLGWHIGLKAAMCHLGLMGITERPPLCELKNDEYDEVAAVTEKIMTRGRDLNLR